MNHRRSKSYSHHGFSISSSSFLKLVTFYLILISVGISLIFCSYKLYIDTWLSDFKSENFLFQEILQGIPQNDSRIVSYVRKQIQGSSHLEYNWSQRMRSGYNGVNTKVRRILGGLDHGYFVEAFAGDGEYGSNTRILEVNHGWTGLLIEPLPSDFQALQQKHRKASLLNACLSPYPYPSVQEFTSPVNYSISEPERSKHWRFHRINCFSLFSILSAIRQFRIDYLSLSAERTELSVLKTIPFTSVNIKVISVRYTLAPEGGDILKDFLLTQGYSLVSEAENQFIFALQALYDENTSFDDPSSDNNTEYEEYYLDTGEITILGDTSFEVDSEEMEIIVNDDYESDGL
ncbi:unnamed protein product [Allacma fusca]|uniref:Protein Star n=1 Tax=Allacma fusca TaxID=39272 RepID=A0A8J2JB44_9HEXA|nr:unnamed protein product [Allacma fusca]